MSLRSSPETFEEMQRRYPDHDWDRLRRSLERRVRVWSAEHEADRDVIFRQDHIPGQQALSDFTEMGDTGVSVAGQPLDHRFYHCVLAYSAWEHAELMLGAIASRPSRSACKRPRRYCKKPLLYFPRLFIYPNFCIPAHDPFVCASIFKANRIQI